MGFKTLTFYTFSNYLNIFLSLVQGFFLLKILSVEEMGSFSQFKIILNYLMLFNLGVLNSLMILIPSSSEEQKNIYKNKIFTINFLIYIIVSLSILSFFLYKKNQMILFLSPAIFFYAIKDFPSYFLKSDGRFKRYSLNLLSSQTIFLFLIIILSIRLKLIGAYLSVIIFSLVSLLFGIFLIGGIKFDFPLPVETIFFIKKGFSIYFVGFLNQILGNFERLFLSFILIKERFAVYATSVFFLSFIQMLPSSIIQYFLPDFVRNTKKYNQKRISLIFTSISVLTFFFIIFSFLFLKTITAIYFKSYVDSVKIFGILSTTVFFDIFFYLLYNKLLSVEKLKIYIFIQIAGSLFLVLGIILYSVLVVGIDLVKFSYFFVMLKGIHFLLTLFFLKIFFRRIKIDIVLIAFLSILFFLVMRIEIFTNRIILSSFIVISFLFLINFKKILLWLKKNLN